LTPALLYALHPEAYNDIDDIREYIADDNPDAADRVITKIFDSIRALVPFPDQGYRRPNLTSRPLRFKLVGEYVIAYAPEKKPLWVVAVFHGRRSPRVIAAILRGRE
jgi:plasmid stabilization system protein ParE